MEALAALFVVPAAGLYYSGQGPDGFSLCTASPGKTFIVILLTIVAFWILGILYFHVYPPRSLGDDWFMFGVLLLAMATVVASGVWMGGARLLQLARCS